MKKGNFIEKFSSGVIVWLMIVIMGFLTLVSLFSRSYLDVTYQEIIYYRKDNIILALLFLAAVFTAVWFGFRKKAFERIPEKPLLIFMLVYVAALSGIWSYISHSYPVADQRSVMRCAEKLIHGNYNCMAYDGYLQLNRHQVGLTAFYELFFRLFAGGLAVYRTVYLFNTVMITGIFLMLYLITKQLTDKKELVILELLLSFGMFPLMLYSTFVYGTIPGLFFAVFGLFFLLKLLKKRKWYYGILMAVMCAISIVLKSNYQIFLIAVGMILIIKAIKEKYPVYLLYLLLAVAGFTGINAAAQGIYEKRTGIEFGDTIPASAYVAMGMQEGPMASGWFNFYHLDTYQKSGYNEDATDEISRQYIKDRVGEFIRNPLECLKFYYRKIVSQWNEVTYEGFWISNCWGNHDQQLSPLVQDLYTGRLHTLAEAVMNLYQLLMFAGTFLYAWSRRKETDVSKMILLLCILGGFFFHILWEGKSQYIISYFPLMLPCAAMGLEKIRDIRNVKKLLGK